MANNTSLGAEALLHVIHLKREEVVSLLLKHGVVVSPNASDMEIAMQVTNLCKKSKSFYNAFTKLIADKKVVQTIYSNMDGNYLGITDFMNDWCNKGDNAKIFPDSCKDSTPSTNGTKDTTGTKDTRPKGKTLTDVLNLLQTGFNGYLQLDENKTKRALADASVQVSQSGGFVNPNAPAPAKSNTALYVGLGILGVSVIGLIVYLATKKKA
jgi:hypothetical protein